LEFCSTAFSRIASFRYAGISLSALAFSFKASTTINCICLPSTTDIPA
jgi:hypothetical protein